MIGLLRSELLKLRTTRTFVFITACALGLMLLLLTLSLALDDTPANEDDLRSLLSVASLSGVFFLVLGVVASAGEYRHGTISTTFLVAPDRLRVLFCQALAYAVAGIAAGLAFAGLTAAIALPWLSSLDAPSLSNGELLGLFLGGVLYSGLAAAFGVAVGAVLRNQVAGIVALLLLVFVIDPALSALLDGYAPYSLGGLGTAISGGSGEDVAGETDLLPVWTAVLLFGAYTLALIGAATVLTRRRDIT
jgi:ABC-2 type transport system permease protein